MAQKIFLDTDIGDDIDDAYALALILASPELDLVGVSTVFGNARARAQQALTVLKIAGRTEVPVAAGAPGVLSPRTSYPFSASQRCLEGTKPLQHCSCLPWKDLPPLSELDGVSLMVKTILEGNGDIIPVTIGAMTNLAIALVQEPRVIEKIPRIVSMAGVFNQPFSEWNIQCDPVAAALVFNSAVPMTVVGLNVTLQCRFDQEHLQRLHEATRPISQNLSVATNAWEGQFPVLHDPLAVETLFAPGVVKTLNGTVSVELSGEYTYGITHFEMAGSDNKGPHDIAVEVDSKKAIETWLDRVLSL